MDLDHEVVAIRDLPAAKALAGGEYLKFDLAKPKKILDTKRIIPSYGNNTQDVILADYISPEKQ